MVYVLPLIILDIRLMSKTIKFELFLDDSYFIVNFYIVAGKLTFFKD